MSLPDHSDFYSFWRYITNDNAGEKVFKTNSKGKRVISINDLPVKYNDEKYFSRSDKRYQY